MLEASGLSDAGCVRSNNEDYFLVSEDLHLYLVADGMGGAQAGEQASKLAADTVAEFVFRTVHSNGGVTTDTLQLAFEEANRKVIQAASSDPELEGMGTTLVAALQVGNDLQITSVGDSRAYLFRGNQLHLITDDQTWVNEVGRKLGIEEATLRNHPMRHVLTMAIGVSGNLRTHRYLLPLRPGTQLLLCSDGLHGVLDEKFLVRALSSRQSFADKCHYLIEQARRAGGPDNITAVIVGVPF